MMSASDLSNKNHLVERRGRKKRRTRKRKERVNTPVVPRNHCSEEAPDS